jgi:hypothetical protein
MSINIFWWKFCNSERQVGHPSAAVTERGLSRTICLGVYVLRFRSASFTIISGDCRRATHRKPWRRHEYSMTLTATRGSVADRFSERRCRNVRSDRGRGRRTRLFRLVAARQFRMGFRLQPAVRDHLCGLTRRSGVSSSPAKNSSMSLLNRYRVARRRC